MDRRAFLMQSGCLVAAGLAAEAVEAPPQPFLLSAQGCGRATGYAETNKIVTWQGRTHVAWLDSPAEGFRARVRTLDHVTGAWSPVYTLGEAYDNHGGPALTVDSEGYLHAVFFPHHHPMRYRRSLRPNDASEWTPVVEVGERLTYPTLVCGPDNTLYLSCRQSNAKSVWTSNLYWKRPGGSWEGPRILMAAEKTGYAHFMDALAWGPDGKTLHLACRFYDGNPARGHTVGYMRSTDRGVTWTGHDGRPLTLPVTAATTDIVRQEREGTGVGLRAAGLAVAPDGRPMVLYADYDAQPPETWVASPDGGGGWTRRPLRQELPPEYADCGLITPGGITFNTGGVLYIVATMVHPEGDESLWGHPTCEPVALLSRDGGDTFSSRLLTEPDPAVPRWLPNLERPTGHNVVQDSPSLLYTEGSRGESNAELLANKVYCITHVR